MGDEREIYNIMKEGADWREMQESPDTTYLAKYMVLFISLVKIEW